MATAEGELTDGQLLKRFTAQKDEAAFTALVQRHGGLVWNVCRRVLRQEQDAEDAFQATFLVLARRAASIRKPESVGSWLYGAAYRIASRAKTEAARRRRHERQVEPMPAAQPEQTVDWSDVGPVLDAEVSRLPEKYRLPFVLCYLEGKTNEAAAHLLGCPLGTILSRLARARERLRGRLARRGLALSVGVLGTLVAENALATAAPASLIAPATKGAITFVTSKATTSADVSARAVSLAKWFLRAGRRSQLMIAALLVLLLMLGTETVLWVRPLLPGRLEGGAGNQNPAPPPARAADPELPGTWNMLVWEENGQQHPPDGNTLQYLIDGQTITFVFQGKRGPPIRYTVDPAKNPKEIDLDQNYRGIYAVEGDTLKLYTRPRANGSERPKEFATHKGDGLFAMIFQRQNPGPTR